MVNLKVWVLGDNRLGNTNQAIALAQEMKETYEIKNISYNCFGKLPNCLLKFWPIHVNKEIMHALANGSLPDIIISSGRRTAPLALYLKRKSNNKSKVIQIMHPDLPYQKFDLVILPQHDNPTRQGQNVIRVAGALNNVQSKLQTGAEDFQKNYPEIDRFVAVIIGGNTKNYNFTAENAKLLSSILTKIGNIPLFISFSRRTPDQVKQIIRDSLPLTSIFYDPTHDDRPNPYLGMLARADYIISTADSISMCSEAASTGKPLYIFCPDNFKSPKHRTFLEHLMDLKIARILNEQSITFESYSYEPLNETQRMAEIVKDRLTCLL